MPRLTVEPHAPVRSLDELARVAVAVESRVEAAYAQIAARMRRLGRVDLAVLLEALAAEARRRRERAAGAAAVPGAERARAAALPEGAMRVFDDEGAAGSAPERASAYGILAMAVRNAQRSFAFWAYVAAHSPADAVRRAAEQMARDVLGRIAVLRRERRHAFHRERAAVAGAPLWTLAGLERRLADLLEAYGSESVDAARLDGLAAAARARADALERAPLGLSRLLRHVPPAAAASCRPAAELLLDCYLDLAETLPTQDGRARAQSYASALLDCAVASARGPEPRSGS